MIKDILLHVSRSYTPYFKTNTAWGAGDGAYAQLDNDINSIELQPIDNSDWTVLTGTLGNGYGIKSDGGIWAWGSATDGLLGDNQSATGTFSPVRIGTRTWVSASGGRNHVVALRSDGTLWSWGDNSFAQLGLGNSVSRSSPVQIGTRTDWTHIYSNGYTNFAKNSGDNALWVWGSVLPAANVTYMPSDELYGTIGITDIETFNWKTVVPHRSYTIGVKQDGTMWSWGINTGGQLGVGDTTGRSSPVQIGTRLWNSVSTNGSTNGDALAVRNDNTLWGWGQNNNGLLGINIGGAYSSPVQVGTLNTWVSSSIGRNHSMMLKNDGTLWSCGNGILGDNNYTIKQVDNVTNWVSASFDPGGNLGHALTLKTDGTMWSWGENSSGQLGSNNTTQRSSPVQIGTRIWKKISAGYRNSFAIRDDDTLWFWGDPSIGGVAGINSSIPRSSPTQIGTLGWKDIKSSADSISHALAIRSDDTLWAWGYGLFGQIGNGGSSNVSSPVQIGTRLWTKVAVGINNSFAIRNDGTLWSWGRNTQGYLGLNDTTQRQSPVQVGTLTTWTDISSQSQSTLALRSDGTLWSWGDNSNGQVGDGTSINKSSPVQIGTETNWASLSAGEGTSTAIKTDGTLWIWGRTAILNQTDTGTGVGYTSPVQIGTLTNWKTIETVGMPYPLFAINTSNEMYSGPASITLVSIWGTPSTRSSPVQIGTDANWTKIYAGSAHSAGIKSDGTLWAWGNNSYNVITNVSSNFSIDSPVQIGSDTWYSFSTSNAISAVSHGGIKTDGTLWSWGSNTYGNLGVNDSSGVVRSSPVQVGTRTWSELSIGSEYTYAIRSDGTLWSWGRADDNKYRLGYVTNANRSSPTQIGTLSGWYGVSAGETHVGAINANFPSSLSYALFTAGGSGVGLGAPQRQIANRGIQKFNPVPIDVNSWYKIEGNDNSFIGIKNDKTLWGWGYSTFGELGLNNTSTQSSPVQVGTRLWNDVVVDHRSRTIAIRDDGTLWSWGLNDSFQLGDLTNVNRSSPVQVGTKTDWIKASIGHFNSYAIDSSNNLWGWGGTTILGVNLRSSTQISPVQIRTDVKFRDVLAKYNNNIANYFISTGSKLYSSGDVSPLQKRGIQFFGAVSPVQIISTKSNWSELSVGTFQAHGIDTTGSLWSWGLNTYLGDPTISSIASHQRSPLQIGTLSNWAKVYSNDQSTFSIKTDGTLWVWGANTAVGNLGTNDTISRSSPVQIGTLTDWSFVDPGGYGNVQDYHTIALKTNGTLFGWGKNVEGAVGDNTGASRISPVQIGTLNTWVSASAGYLHSAGIRNDGTLWMWGLNSSGQLGDLTVLNKISPVQIGTETNWYKVAAGLSYTMGIKNDKTLWGWGKATPGIGRLVNRSTPVAVNVRQSFTNISAGGSFFGITNSGILWSWGLNSNSQLGLGDTINRSSPVQVGTRTWSDVSAGTSYTMAIRSDNTLWGWGLGSTGQIGEFSTATRNSPVQIGTRADWAKISAGVNVTMAIRNDGTLWGWGGNASGQLGLYQPNPIYLTSTDYWNNAEANNQAVILKRNTDNTLWSVGRNDSGQLGLNDTTFRESPVQIGTRSWNAFSIGFTHTLSILNDGTLWTWGTGNAGQHGIALDTSIPQLVETTIKWSRAEVGARHAISINSGSLWGWGLNSSGQLGLGDGTARSSPVQIGTETNWSLFDPGDNHTLAIKSDGTLWSWGSNSVGQLGLNLATSDNRSSPVQIGTETNWSKVFGSEAATYGIKTDGTLWAWGSNALGKLGLNLATTVHRSSPVQVGTDTNWSTVADIGGNSVSHTMAIKTDGTLWAWGSNSIGQLGLNLGATAHRSSPVQVGTRADWAAVTVGNLHTVARRTDGTIWTWGSNAAGQLGLNLLTTAHRSSPVQIGTLTWGDIAAGGSQTMAVRNDGTMWGWGLNTNRQIGDGTTVTKSSPVQVGTLSTWVSASVGEANSMLLTNDGTAYATGLYAQGYLLDYTISRSSPIQVGTRTWTSVSAGNTHSMGIRSDGTLWGWGLGGNGQIGDIANVNRSSPVQIGTRTWNYVSAGNSYTMAIRSDSTLWSWGFNSSGQLGIGNVTAQNSPVQIGTRTWSRVADIKGSSVSHTIAVRDDGTLWGWGLNSAGQLGLNLGTSAHRSSPVQIGTDTNWLLAEVGDTSTLAIKTDGTLWAWGDNTNSQLGVGDNTLRSSPTQVGTLNTWVSASMGSTHAVLLSNDSSALTTGVDNKDFRLFNINRSSPVQIGTLSNWSSVQTYQSHNLAIKTDGTLWSWGITTAALGINTNTTRLSPVQVGTETNWYSLAKSGNNSIAHSIAIKTDGTLWSWGNNASGQLGLLDSISRSSPVQIGTRTDWISAAISTNQTVAVRNDNTMWSWGAGTNGLLGTGDTISRSSPVQIGTGLSWVSASIGDNGALYLSSLNRAYIAGTVTNAIGFEVDFDVARSSPVQIGNWVEWSDVVTSHAAEWTIAKKSDGSLWAWGDNTYGQLGQNDLIVRSSPVQVGNYYDWKKIYAGGRTILGIREF